MKHLWGCIYLSELSSALEVLRVSSFVLDYLRGDVSSNESCMLVRDLFLTKFWRKEISIMVIYYEIFY